MEITINALEQYLGNVPMFPLPQIVFFPHTVLPLHIFEPRYRQMIRDVRAEGLPIVMGHIPTDRRLDPHGRPEILPIAGAGFMTACEELPDGRFLIELSGISRVRVLEEHDPVKMYRTVVAQIVDEIAAPAAVVDDLRNTLDVLVLSLTQENAKVGAYLQNLMARAGSPGAVADTLASAVVSEPTVRQSLLEDPHVEARLRSVTTRLAELLAIAAQPKVDTPLN